jgi:putative Holliday junction resolvase
MAETRAAGIDFGTVRIGIALSDPSRTWVSPHATYTRRGNEPDAQFFRRLAQQEEIGLFVVGLPIHLDGGESQKSTEARQFAQWLAAETSVPVTVFDERFSSVEADALLAERSLTQRRRKQRRDALAAQIILQAYLETPDAR